MDYTLVFAGHEDHPFGLSDFDDEAVERCLEQLELVGTVERDARTGFPPFSVYRDGEWVVGG